MHEFGGSWTEKKLARVEEYLKAYLGALKNQSFNKIYIDAFAGTGYYKPKQNKSVIEQLFIDGEDTLKFKKGSAAIALGLENPFDTYIFIEKDPKYFKELVTLKDKFPHLSKRMIFINEDSNISIKRICGQFQPLDRAVLFLDPYGLQVEWSTIQAIAETRSIDLWILFPHASGVNRLLKNEGDLPDYFRERLNKLFGTENWEDAFYPESDQTDMFEGESRKKSVTPDDICRYYINRLKSVFPGVHSVPYILYDDKGVPKFTLCFAVGNERGKNIALRIAKHILKQED